MLLDALLLGQDAEGVGQDMLRGPLSGEWYPEYALNLGQHSAYQECSVYLYLAVHTKRSGSRSLVVDGYYY